MSKEGLASAVAGRRAIRKLVLSTARRFIALMLRRSDCFGSLVTDVLELFPKRPNGLLVFIPVVDGSGLRRRLRFGVRLGTAQWAAAGTEPKLGPALAAEWNLLLTSSHWSSRRRG